MTNEAAAAAEGITLYEWLERRDTEYYAQRQASRDRLANWLRAATSDQLDEVCEALLNYAEEYGAEQAFIKFIDEENGPVGSRPIS